MKGVVTSIVLLKKSRIRFVDRSGEDCTVQFCWSKLNLNRTRVERQMDPVPKVSQHHGMVLEKDEECMETLTLMMRFFWLQQSGLAVSSQS